jgi:hypothetical protein
VLETAQTVSERLALLQPFAGCDGESTK